MYFIFVLYIILEWVFVYFIVHHIIKSKELICTFFTQVTAEEVVVQLLTEKRFYLWRCKECNFEFHERFSIILNKYLSSETKDLKEMCPFCAELKEKQDNISFDDLMNEWDYLNNLILGDPERIPNNTQLRFWWICKNNPEHRYRMAIVDKIANVKRSIEPCMFCKGRRRKREHFVPYRKI